MFLVSEAQPESILDKPETIYMKRVTTSSFEETQQMGEDFAKQIPPGQVIALYGELGSGKTTFVQGFAKGLGISSQIISPTFIIMRTYEVDREDIETLYHIDLYRIEGDSDVESLGLSDIFADKKSIVLIEWPEKIENLLPADRTDIVFKHLEDDKREIMLK